MPEARKVVMKLKFNAERYSELGLDAAALSEVLTMQEILTEAGKVAWRLANPTRKNLPPRYGAELELWMRPLEPGSTIAPLEARRKQRPQQNTWDNEVEYMDLGAQRLAESYTALANGEPVPEGYDDKDFLALAGRFGATFDDNEEVEILTTGRPPVVYNKRVRVAVVAAQGALHETSVELSGTVTMADVLQRRFNLKPDSGKAILVEFTPVQEAMVLDALREHASMRLRVRGVARMSPEGQIAKLEHVDFLGPIDPVQTDGSASDFVDEILKICSAVPAAEFDKLPKDAAQHLDHYLYGSPKRRG
jgi:hypothetical protein